MSALETLEKREIKELLSKGWITHDAMWFAHSLQTVGIEKTNLINKAAVQSMAVIEVSRLKKALGFQKDTITSFDELTRFMTDAMDLVLANFMHFQVSVPQKNVIHWEMEKGDCFAYKGITGLGVIDHYECGVLHRIRTWLSALKINFEMTPNVHTCIMHTQGDCSGNFIFNLA